MNAPSKSMSPPGRIRSAIPANPTSSPPTTARDGRRPVAASSSVESQSGMVATISAAMPESIRTSAHARPHEDVEDRSRDEEADRGHQERRQGLDRNHHPEVGRTPDDVDRPERREDGGFSRA